MTKYNINPIYATGNRRDKLFPEQRKEIIAFYYEGIPYRTIAAKYDIGHATVWNILKKNKILRNKRTVSEEEFIAAREKADFFRVTKLLPDRIIIPDGKGTRHSINRDAFSAVTPESAYWLGMLMSDGNVWNRTITLQLSGEDQEHVNRFKNFLGSTHAISIIPAGITTQGCKRKQAAHFQFTSGQITNDLSLFGIFPRKSHNAKAIHIENHPDFWRGVIDGDGCITGRKSNGLIKLSLVGTQDLLEQFSNFVKTIYPKTNIKVVPIKNNAAKAVSIHGKEAAIIIDVLYHNAVIALPRKAQKAIDALNRVHKSSG